MSNSRETTMVGDTIQEAQLRRAIKKEVETMDLRLLMRIAYESRCDELCVRPDSWKLYPEED